MLIVWQFICSTVGTVPFYSLYYSAKVLLPAYLLFLVALTFYRCWDDIERTAVALAVGAIVASIAGLIEWKTRAIIFLPFFPTDPEQLAGLERILVDKSRGGDYRVSGTFSHPLALAEYLCMVLPLVVMLAAKALRRWHRVLAWSFLPLLFAMLYLSYTRSALIASVGSLLAIALLFWGRAARQRKRPGLAMLGWVIVVGAVATAAILSGSLGYLFRGRTQAENGSSNARLIMLRRTEALAADQPIVGYGPAMAGIKIGRLPGQSQITVDSYYLTLVIESGFVGVGLFLLGMLGILARSRRRELARRSAAPSARRGAGPTAARFCPLRCPTIDPDRPCRTITRSRS